MGDEELGARKSIEGKLGYRVHDCVWKRAVRDFRVEYEQGRLQELQETVEDLQLFAEEVERERGSGPTTGRRRSTDRVRYLDENESDLRAALLAESFYIDADSRAALRAMSEYAALRAAEHPGVAEFRARALGAGYLSIEQGSELLHSYAARFLTLDKMRELGVPLSGHEAFLLGPYTESGREGFFDHSVALRVAPPGISIALRYTNDADASVDDGGLVRCEVEAGEVVAPYKIELPPMEVPGTGDPDVSGEPQRTMGSILISGFDTEDRPANVWPGSLVDELYGLAQELSESFMWPSRGTRGWMGTWWNADAAALFVLTGEAPLVHPIKVSVARAGEGTDIPSQAVLEVLPWLNPGSVVEAYKSVRRALDVKLRNQGDLKFDVVTFVLSRVRSLDPDTSDFRRLRESWNTAYPKRKFRDTNSFSTNFKRGLEAVEKRYYL